MKKCNTCNVEKDELEFHWRVKAKNSRKNRCKECVNSYTKQHYVMNKQSYLDKAKRHRMNLSKRVRKLKEKPCADCQVQYPFYVMQFDHLQNKNFNISKLDKSWTAIQQEILKCDIVCANCHSIRTYKRYHNLPL
jgi:hypothetical protein